MSRKPRASVRGFASMPPAIRRSIASYGGVMAHRRGRAHQWTAAEAQAAGRKGVLAKRLRPDPKDAIIAALKATVAELQAIITQPEERS